MKHRLTVLIFFGMASLPLASQDWPMWGGTPQRNMISPTKGLPDTWEVKTGKPNWTFDMMAPVWGSPLVVDGKVYLGDQDGDVAIFKAGAEMKKISEIDMGNSVYSTPVPANGVLYILTPSDLYAIAASAGGAEK